MKNILFIALASIGFAACNSEETKTGKPEMASVALEFVQNPESIISVSDPIQSFIYGAESASEESYSLEKDNAKLMMTKVKDFDAAVVIVENHTIALMNKKDECRNSASWGTCMYYARGYIKKGELQYNEDFLNNIIGKPDGKKRTIYFFNE